jgi:hypothetical protein
VLREADVYTRSDDGANSSPIEAQRRERQDARQGFVVAVEMKDCGLVLVRAGCNQEVWYRDAMLAPCGELRLGHPGDRDRRGIRA